MRHARGLAAVLVALLALAGCGGGEDDGRAGRELPRTAFERERGARWTTLAEETRFLRALDDASERVRVTRVGTSLQGRPLRLVVVGPPRTRAQIAAGSSALFVCTQHGDEPAGREACLRRIRDHAASSDDSTLLFLPTANPDGVAAQTRGNADGRDVNRDHLDLETPEARAIATVMRDLRPDVLGDLHEYRLTDAEAVLFQPPERGHPNADRAVRALSAAAVTTYLAPRLEAAGYRTGDYVSGGAPSPEILLNMAGLRHTAGALVETPRRGPLSPARRVRAHLAAIDALVALRRERAAPLARATGGARRRAADGPCGFRLDEEQLAEARETLALHGVHARREGTSWLVPVAQPAGPVVPLLLDPGADDALAEGEPVPC